MYIPQDRPISASFLILISGNITVSLALRTYKEELQVRVSLNQPLVKGKSWTNTLISFTFATLGAFCGYHQFHRCTYQVSNILSVHTCPFHLKLRVMDLLFKST